VPIGVPRRGGILTLLESCLTGCHVGVALLGQPGPAGRGHRASPGEQSLPAASLRRGSRPPGGDPGGTRNGPDPPPGATPEVGAGSPPVRVGCFHHVRRRSGSACGWTQRGRKRECASVAASRSVWCVSGSVATDRSCYAHTTTQSVPTWQVTVIILVSLILGRSARVAAPG